MSDDEDWGAKFYKILAVLFLIGLGGYIGLGGCKANEGEVQEALHGHGFTNVELGGRRFFKCEGEATRAFTATNAAGERVEGTVCCGLIGKGCTVRW